MKLFVISDTHGKIEGILKKIQEEKPDIILHLGDFSQDAEDIRQLSGIPVKWVRGNCDISDWESPLELQLGFSQYSIWMTHGHLYHVKNGTSLLKGVAKQQFCDIVLFGHTHKRHHEVDSGIAYFNPGAIYGGTPSFGEIVIEEGNYQIIHRNL